MDLLSLVPLVDKPELVDSCISLLNEEWPRSKESRQIALEKVLNRKPPMAFVLVNNLSQSFNSLVGHARLCPLSIGESEECCWVESVVIWKAMRGYGFGRILMQKLEEEAKRHGYTKMCLSTTDKFDFYRRCAFLECAPIVNCGSNARLFARNGLSRFLNSGSVRSLMKETEEKQPNAQIDVKYSEIPYNQIPKIPAPPPLLCIQSRANEKRFMFKSVE